MTMKQAQTCPKCNGTDIVKARPIDHGHGNTTSPLRVITYANPNAILLKGTKKSELEAWVCKGCGFVEWYASAPSEL